MSKILKAGDVLIKINSQKLIMVIANSGMSAKELAEKCGISQVTIARFKSGTQKARLQTAGKLAKTLGVKVEDLI